MLREMGLFPKRYRANMREMDESDEAGQSARTGAL
jgi:hypothetical protein